MNVQYECGIYEFGPFRADLGKRQLSREGKPIALTCKAFDTLLILLDNRGATVSKGELMNAIWAESAIEENNLTQQICTLRKALGERPDEHRFIVTLPGRGYSFVSQVRQVSAETYETELHPSKPRNGPKWTGSVMAFLDKSRLIGYGLAVWLIVTICFPVLLSSLRHSAVANRPACLAVLEFRSSGSDRFIGTGISDTLRARLGSVQDLSVCAASAVRSDKDVIAAGRELNAEAVLTGSVQRADERLRVTVEMVNVADGRIVWGKTFDDSSANIFALQDSIVGEVARVLRIRFTSQIGDRLRQGFGLLPRQQYLLTTTYDHILKREKDRSLPGDIII
jgi:DNA-binding winged helix-turn-helix (wHTH) protein/TolB-like protein